MATKATRVPTQEDKEMMSEMMKTLSTIVPDRKCVELRIQNKKGNWMSGFYDAEHMEQLAVDALIVDQTYNPTGSYVTLNSINPDLLARRKNRFETFVKSGTLTDDDSIVNWDYLPIDIDPVRPAGISSTKEELALCEAKADEVVAYLTSIGFPLPMRACSGNGIHLLYRINLPRSTENDIVVKTILTYLDKTFSKEKVVGVDTANNNPSRIFKLYGTWARKGDNTEERPHRKSKITFVPDPFLVVEDSVLLGLFRAHPLPASSGKKKGSKLKNPKDVTSRHPELLKVVGKEVNANVPDESIQTRCRELNAKFNEPKPLDVLTKEVADLIKFCKDRQAEIDKKPPYVVAVFDPETGELSHYVLDYVKYSDFLHSTFHVYNFQGSLYIYDSKQGVYKTHLNQIETHIRNTCKEHDVIGKLSSHEKELLVHLTSMGNVDDYPFIGTFGTIHVRNGSLNLSTGVVADATSDNLYDYRIETAYKTFPEGTPELDAFLKIYGTTEPVDVLAKCIWQRAFHDSLKELTIFFGPKDCGKTTLAELVQATIDGDLNKKKGTSRTLLHELLARFGYATLEGKLLNFGDDLPDQFIRNAGRINELVGSVVRHVEKKGVDGYDCTVTAYYLFTANNLPPLDDDDSVIWAKIHLVEFPKAICVKTVPRETLFTETLKQQMLFRAVEKALSWRDIPYENSQDSEDVRKKWQESSSDVDEFIGTYAEFDVSCSATLDQVKAHYHNWCARFGKTSHVKYLQRKIQGFVRRQTTGNVYWLRLKPFEVPTKQGGLPAGTPAQAGLPAGNPMQDPVDLSALCK